MRYRKRNAHISKGKTRKDTGLRGPGLENVGLHYLNASVGVDFSNIIGLGS